MQAPSSTAQPSRVQPMPPQWIDQAFLTLTRTQLSGCPPRADVRTQACSKPWTPQKACPKILQRGSA